jgi:hypothetical protein
MILTTPYFARIFLAILCLASMLIFGGLGATPAYACDASVSHSP